MLLRVDRKNKTFFLLAPLLAPALFLGCTVIQNLWKEKIGWDEEIQDHHLEVWHRWTHSLPQLEEI